MLFKDLGLSPEVLEAVESVGYSEATPIQSQTIPILLTGKDLTGQAQTGTGKTAAFGIPAIERIDISINQTQSLILCPTRELALQVATELKKLAKFKKGLRVLAVYGGESIERQIKDLKFGAHIVVGTPGRIIDHLDRRTLNAGNISQIILDEADEMLNMGFREDIELILTRLPEERQTVLFSATLAPPILALAKRFQNNPEIIKVERKELTISTVEQFYYIVRNAQKTEIVTQIIDLNNLQLMLIFCNTKRKVEEVTDELKAYGHNPISLHGDKTQRDRTEVMNKFRKGVANILVATDVAARGIDVTGVDAVINYDVPLDIENYVHRIGRTGRAGQLGKSFTLVTNDEKYKLRDIERYTKASIERAETPTRAELVAYKKSKLATRIATELEKPNIEIWSKLLEEYKEQGITADQIAIALLSKEMKDLAEPERKERTFEDRGDRRDRNDRGGDRGGRFDRGDRGDRRDGPRRDGRSSDRFGDRPAASRDRDGGDRRERAPRPRMSSENMARLFVNVGRIDRINPGDIVGAFAGEANIKGTDIGQIDIFDKYSFVELPHNLVDQVMDGMRNNKIKGKSINIEISNAK
jgi:ATP-dependent RNA helicase DeaD